MVKKMSKQIPKNLSSTGESIRDNWSLKYYGKQKNVSVSANNIQCCLREDRKTHDKKKKKRVLFSISKNKHKSLGREDVVNPVQYAWDPHRCNSTREWNEHGSSHKLPIHASWKLFQGYQV